ncbi:glutathione peroxidase [Homoserinimonas aerilata]|uniref:Glutathione peroxidase n=2 Tax=Homoserinimonas aerilata TaxID=1162970 RepID=A0A542YGA5_9MICO|nr:glutathione peroxidase [Homoserinimonas aerilata]
MRAYAGLMAFDNIELTRIDGTPDSFDNYRDRVVLVVNVASRCGLAPQYEQLEQLQEKYGPRGFTVLGFPSNQFAQELKTAEDIQEYCSTTWGVTFPMFEKTKVNGKNKHPIYKELHKAKDSAGLGGPIVWNFEKFLILPGGEVHRFRPPMKPDDPEIVALIEGALAKAA